MTGSSSTTKSFGMGRLRSRERECEAGPATGSIGGVERTPVVAGNPLCDSQTESGPGRLRGSKWDKQAPRHLSEARAAVDHGYLNSTVLVCFGGHSNLCAGRRGIDGVEQQ